MAINLGEKIMDCVDFKIVLFFSSSITFIARNLHDLIYIYIYIIL